MYFYRIMQEEELKSKKINNNAGDFFDAINTHKYIKGVNYVHLFLNAESCFEDFILDDISNLVLAKFNIPDEIIFKYGIGLGGYQLFSNKCTRKYRELVTKNSAGTYNFWVPEIAIPEFDFNYDWCIDICKPKRVLYQYTLPESYITDDVMYQQIVSDGYLKGYKNEIELLNKYKDMLKYKKKIINTLKKFKTININPKDLNNDSLYTCSVLMEYALSCCFVDSKSDIKITVKDKLVNNSINIASNHKFNENNSYIIIDKNINHTIPSFITTLDKLGFNVDRCLLKFIYSETDVNLDKNLVKK